jgi:hypothetical protein
MAVLVLIGISIPLTGSVAAQSTGYVDVDASDLAGSGTTSDPYLITNASELQAIEDDLDANYELSTDIDATSTATWNNGSGFDPIGESSNNAFSGVFDSNGYRINNISINRPEMKSIGLFSYSRGTIRKTKLLNVDINGSAYTGAIAGHNDGGVISSSYVSGSVNGSYSVGGIAGVNNNGSVILSYTNSTVNSYKNRGIGGIGGVVGENRNGIIRSAYSTGVINGFERVGGIVGQNTRGTVNSSYSTGTINGSESIGGVVGSNYNGTVKSSNASGHITGNQYVGGVIGNNYDGSIVSRSYFTGSVNGSYYAGGVVGYNHANIEQSYSTGFTNGYSRIGGVAGYNSGVVQSSYLNGGVDGSTLTGGVVGSNLNGTVNSSYGVGTINGFAKVGGIVGYNSTNAVVLNSYWDINSTDQLTTAGNGTGLTTSQMIGQTSSTNMAGFDFQNVWRTRPSSYPLLGWQSDEQTNKSDPEKVNLSNVHLAPQSVYSDSQSMHQLTFEAQNISADGSEDEFEITFPDNVELDSFSDVEIDEKSSGVNKTDNTLEFSVNPTGSGSTKISGKLNVTLSATN